MYRFCKNDENFRGNEKNLKEIFIFAKKIFMNPPVDTNLINKIFEAKLSSTDFLRLSNFIYTEYGIKMPPAKKIMLQSRLQKRLRELNLTSYKQYIDFVFSKEGQHEIINMIDVVSTNKTDFFRESAHFDYLSSVFLPEFMRGGIRKTLKIWSAGCSSGEEPYTMAIVLAEYMLLNPLFDFFVYATDISTKVLQKAVTAVYAEDRVEIIPMSLKRKYLLRSKDKTKKSVRIVPQLRQKVMFNRVNFMDSNYSTPDNFDVIFCRNVLIYFDRETQEKVINKLCNYLKKGGFFFLGHSESITNMNVPLQQVKPTIFRRI